MTSAASPASAAPKATLRITNEEGATRIMPLEKPRLVVGRTESADVQLVSKSRAVSRRHAELFCDPFGRWWVRDMESRNGTWVNDQKITEQVLKPGDDIAIGGYRLQIEEPIKPEEHAPPSQESTDGLHVADDSPATHISTFGQQDAAKIDTMHLSTLKEFGARLMQTNNARERLRLLCRLLVRADFHGRAAVGLRLSRQQPDYPPQLLCEPQSVAGTQDPLPYISRRLLTALRRSEGPVLATQRGADPGAIELSIAPERPSQSALACPIHSDAQYLDLLYVTMPPEFGTPEWLALVSLAAQQYQQATVALDMRRKAEVHAALTQELDRAQSIQMRLVPKDRTMPGLEVAFGFKPCLWVGGDYVDAIQARDGRVVLITADVSGKGLSAALMASELHAISHTLLSAGQSLKEVMHGLNEHLCQYLEERSFVTMVAVAVHPGTGELECINAGHPPALVLDGKSNARRLQSGANLPLGVQNEPMESMQDQLAPGHLLGMYTDGLSELTVGQTSRMLGITGVSDELVKLYGTGHTSSLTQLADGLSKRLDKLQGDQIAADDRTFLLARRPT